MTKKQLLKAIGKAYPGDFPTYREQALGHDNGDPLADFIYLEIDETQDDDQVDLNDAERIIRTAMDDLAKVLACILGLQMRPRKEH